MKKFQIFKHLVDSFLVMGALGKYHVIDDVNKGVLTGFPSPLFNFLNFGEFDKKAFEPFFSAKAPFICLPQENTENGCHEFCAANGLITDGEQTIAQEFADLSSFNYAPNKDIKIKRITSEEEMNVFDKISSISFQHPEEMAFNFLKPLLETDKFEMFLAYCNDSPVGCGIISFVNNQAGLYWGGVLPEHRKKGVGSELTKYRMNIAKNKGYQSICAQNMPMSFGYYQKIGFEPHGALPFYIWLGEASS